MPVTFLHSCCDTVLLGDRPHIASRREETCTGFHRHKCYLLCCIESMCLSFSGLPFSAMAHCCHAPASSLVRCYTSCLRTRLVFSSPHLTSLLPAASCLNLLSYFTTCCHGWRFASLTILSLYAVSALIHLWVRSPPCCLEERETSTPCQYIWHLFPGFLSRACAC